MSHTAVANKYAAAVVAGDVPACKWVQLACQRHLADLRSSKGEGFPFHFDHSAADKVCRFIETMPHVKGKWAAKGMLLKLEPWQVFFVCSIFGWMRDNGKRRYRQALLWVPRKNGKSALAAAIGLYMLTADREFGAEVYCGANTQKQALDVIFSPAKQMAMRSPQFLDYFGVDVNASNIAMVENNSKLEPVIGKPGDGASPHCAIVDEYHEHDSDVMYDAFLTGMGAREQPLLLMITTAGSNLAGPCYQMQTEAQKMLEGVIEDPETFALIYTIDENDDWTDPATLIKANPNYGVSVDDEFLLARLSEAKGNSRKQSTFKTKHLNVWVGARDAFFNLDRWQRCKDTSLKLSDFEGQQIYLGMDLASKIDIATVEILIPLGDNDFVRFGKYYLPESAIENGVNDHYRGWMADGWLTITDGETIDYRTIRDDMLELSSKFEVKELAFDPYNATMLVGDLMDDGMQCVEVRPTVPNFSDPMKTLDGMIRAGQIRHNGDPVMTWMISNVVAFTDAKDNVYPRKEKPENKIDGVVSLLSALNRAIVKENNDPPTVQQGFIAL